jgi:hypothetical protein
LEYFLEILKVKLLGSENMKYVIDRFEGEYAICENESGEMIKIEKCRLPLGIVEGDVIIIDGYNISIDRDETEKRKVRIEKLMGELWE